MSALLVAAANLRKIRTWLDIAIEIDGQPHAPDTLRQRAEARRRNASLKQYLPCKPDAPPDICTSSSPEISTA